MQHRKRLKYVWKHSALVAEWLREAGACCPCLLLALLACNLVAQQGEHLRRAEDSPELATQALQQEAVTLSHQSSSALLRWCSSTLSSGALLQPRPGLAGACRLYDVRMSSAGPALVLQPFRHPPAGVALEPGGRRNMLAAGEGSCHTHA